MSETSGDLDQIHRILIVDDEDDTRDLIGIALASKNLDLRFAKNGKEAIAVFQSEHPDLIILDVQMPEMDGLEVCRIVKAQSGPNFVPILMLTSQSEDAEIVHGLECGADDYITKPFSLSELSARVDAFLRIKTLTDQLRQTQNLLEQREKELVAMQVAGAAAHALGQPVTSIVLNCELIGSLEPSSKDFQACLGEISSESRRVKDVLHALNSLKSYKPKPYVADMNIVELGHKGESQE